MQLGATGLHLSKLGRALWLRVYRWRWLAGVPFAIASAFVHYPMTSGGERWGILGFPFIVAAFDSAGRDYVGALTTPSMLANAVVWFFFPQIVLFFWGLVGSKKPQEAAGAA